MVEGTGICSAGIEAGGGMSRSNISQHHHKKHTQFMEMKNMSTLRTIGPTESFSCWLS